MCTMISKTIPVKGNAKESSGWFDINTINISYDHPFESNLDYAINIDIPNESSDRFSRIILELSPASAAILVDGLKEILAHESISKYHCIVPSKESEIH